MPDAFEKHGNIDPELGIRQGQPSFRWYWSCFAILTVVIGGVMLTCSEESFWWAYYEDPLLGRVDKFKAHWTEQLFLCGAVGSIFAVPATLIVSSIRTIWSRRNQKRSAK